MRRLRDSRVVLWAVLLLPAVSILYAYATDALTYGEVVHRTGDWSVRLLIVTMAVTPMSLLLPRAWFPRWLIRRRRDLGLATFVYALLHTVVYLERKADLALIIREGLEPGLWTGWLAFAVFAALAGTSNNASVRRLGLLWKSLHRLIYLGAFLTFAHWLLVAFDVTMGLVYAGILAAIELVRVAFSLWRMRKSPSSA